MGPRSPGSSWLVAWALLGACLVGSGAGAKSSWCGCPSAHSGHGPFEPTLAPPVHSMCRPFQAGTARTCQAFDLPYPNQHPLDEDTVRRARAGVGDVTGLQRVLCAAAGGKTLHVVVVGGSVTAGTHCKDPHGLRDIDCGWPARLAVWLDTAFPKGAPHHVENLSERASSSLVATELLAPHRTRLSDVDLFILDYAVNDASNVQLKPAFRKSTERAEAALFANASHGGGGDGFCSSLSGEYRDKLLVATERLVRWCISLPSRPAILFYDTFNPRVDWHKQAQEVHLTVASYYQLPVISYRDAVWHRWRELGAEAHAVAHAGTHAGQPRDRGHDRGAATPAGEPWLGGGGPHGKKRRRARGSGVEADRSLVDNLHERLPQRRALRGLTPLADGDAAVPAAFDGAARPLCAALGLAPLCGDAFWSRSLHPPWFVHQLLADLLSLSLADEHRRGCGQQAQAASQGASTGGGGGGFSSGGSSGFGAGAGGGGAVLARVRALQPLFGMDGSGGGSAESGRGAASCSAPLSVMSTLRTAAAAQLRPLAPSSLLPPAVTVGEATTGWPKGWSLEEDVPGKPGWIAHAAGAEVSFDLNFERGDLIVGFLRSYMGLGKALVWVTAGEDRGASDEASSSLSSSLSSSTAGGGGGGGGGAGGRLSERGAALAASPVVLDGLWDERKSELAKHQLSGLGHGKLRVHFRSLCHDRGSASNGHDAPQVACKFKLLLLMSC